MAPASTKYRCMVGAAITSVYLASRTEIDQIKLITFRVLRKTMIINKSSGWIFISYELNFLCRYSINTLIIHAILSGTRETGKLGRAL
jgi:hypothetical protein